MNGRVGHRRRDQLQRVRQAKLGLADARARARGGSIRPCGAEARGSSDPEPSAGTRAGGARMCKRGRDSEGRLGRTTQKTRSRGPPEVTGPAEIEASSEMDGRGEGSLMGRTADLSRIITRDESGGLTHRMMMADTQRSANAPSADRIVT